ncbi:hypothetical protein IAT38_007912 [Cryptococcus sp. DSM 104549]
MPQRPSIRTQSPSASSSKLPLPALPSFAFKGSFTSLTRLIGIAKASATAPHHDESSEDVTDQERDRDDEGETDEETLLWNAQTALIAHHPDLAIKLYAQAALPPICSSSACLALGNLLIRGSGLMEAVSRPLASSPDEPVGSGTASAGAGLGTTGGKGKGRADVGEVYGTHRPSFFSRLFGSPVSPPPATSPTLGSPTTTTERRKPVDLISAGWQIPKEGKRAVRDVEGMGVAGAWFVLGLGWIVQAELEREKQEIRDAMKASEKNKVEPVVWSARDRLSSPEAGDDEVIVFSGKGKGKQRAGAPGTGTGATGGLADSVATLSSVETVTRSVPETAASGSERTDESSELKTPATGDVGRFEEEDESEGGPLSAMYELLRPLLRLYRHGHIQQQDPVALPPISLQQLPPCLRPRNEVDKGRNVWYLGRVVMQHLVKLKLLTEVAGSPREKSNDRVRSAVVVLTHYILAMTSHGVQAEGYFRAVAMTHPIGLEIADDLITQAGKRLRIFTSTPRDETGSAGFPFPFTAQNLSPDSRVIPGTGASPGRRRASHQARKPSISSVLSTVSPPRMMSQPTKSSASLAALATDWEDGVQSPVLELGDDACAVSTLKRVQAKAVADDPVEDEVQQDDSRWPSLNGWRMSPPSAELQASQPLATAPRPVGRRTSTSAAMEHGQNIPQLNTISVSPAHTLRPVASSPQISSLRSSEPAPRTAGSRRQLPFEPTEAVAPIDPALAAAELSSALTKHVECGVCGMRGVNFPNCRKCGLTFCSRACRVDDDKAGNGKRHICGYWESRKLLSVPSPNMSPLVKRTSHGQPLQPVAPTVRAAKVH